MWIRTCFGGVLRGIPNDFAVRCLRNLLIVAPTTLRQGFGWQSHEIQNRHIGRFFFCFLILTLSSKLQFLERVALDPFLNYFVSFFNNSIDCSAFFGDSMANIAFGQCCLTSFITFLISIVPLVISKCSSKFSAPLSLP